MCVTMTDVAMVCLFFALYYIYTIGEMRVGR